MEDLKELKEKELAKMALKTCMLSKPLVLAIISASEDEASKVYINNKLKAAKKAGIATRHICLSGDEEDIINHVIELNNDESVTGIIVQLPLKDGVNETRVVNTINSLKDVDGLTYENIGKYVSNEKGLVPCTALGVMEILDNLNTDLIGKNIVIVGRSKLVGLPLYHLLLNRNATPIICHTKTENLTEYTKKADIVILAAGVGHILTSEMIKDGAIIIDVSIVRDKKTSKLYGDACYEDVLQKASYVTPVPGGVGQMTVLELMRNVYTARELQEATQENQVYCKKISKK